MWASLYHLGVLTAGGCAPSEGQGCTGTLHLPLNFVVNLKLLKNSPLKIYIYIQCQRVREEEQGKQLSRLVRLLVC